MENGIAPQWLDERFNARSDFDEKNIHETLSDRFQSWRIKTIIDVIEHTSVSSPWYKARLNRGRVKTVTAQLTELLNQKSRDSSNVNWAISEILNALPSPSAADVAADSEAFLAVGHGDIEGVVSVPSSGTSGPAKRLCSTALDMEETVRFFEYGMRFMVGPGRDDRVALAMSQTRPGNVADLLGRAMERLGVSFEAFGFMPEGTEEDEWVWNLAEWRPTCLVGVPPQMLSLARHRLGRTVAETVRTVLLSGDVASNLMVGQLRENFGAEIFRHYGLTETGLGGAVECGQHLWPHLRDDLLVEILDGTGRPVTAPDDFGEIAFTTLTREAMPLIRYRTGDEGRLLAAPCPCGSMLPRLETIGRMDDHLILNDGRKLRTPDFEKPLLPLTFVRGYNLHLSGDNLLIAIKPGPGLPPDGPGLIQKKVAEWLGPSAGLIISVSIATPTANETSTRITGKRRLLRS
ncbi:hypothetical protein C4J81_04090 [Deltaproteobacteria bacterium Smac51]|nr:hypothetical protein C4J81_04090 [Deltaproteobacteria bacterium Smac51]